MSKLRILTTLSIGLLIINFLLVGFILFKRNGQPRNEGPRNIIIEKLHFDEAQVMKYDTLIQWHRKEIRKIESEILNIKNQLYSHLSTSSLVSVKDSLVQEIALRQINIEQIHLKHFEDIKILCRDKQLDDYQRLTKELASYFSPGIKKKR